MVDPDILNYIKSMKDSGFSDEETRKKLFDAGWDQNDVNEALGTGSTPTAAALGAKPAQPQATGNELSVFTIVGNAFNFMTGEFKFWKDFFFALLILQIVSLIVTGVASFFMTDGTMVPSDFGTMSSMGMITSILPLLLLSVGVGIVIGAVSLIIQLGLLKGVDARLNGKNLTLQEGFSFGTSKIVTAIFTTIIVMLMTLLGFLCLIIPGIYLLVPLVLILPAIAIGNKDVGSAISECFSLTKGRWWKGLGMGLVVVGIGLAFTVAVTLVMFPVSLIFSLLSNVLADLGPGAALVPTLLNQAIQTALILPLTIFGMVVLVMYYRNLREWTPR